MSLYYEKLSQLKREIRDIENNRKKKRWKQNQKTMIDFINAVTNKAIFIVKGETLVLEHGDERFGFEKILVKHYNTNDLSALDVVNIAEVFERGITLNEVGVSNNDNTVYSHTKDGKRRLLVTGKNELGEIVVSYYRKT